jgi:glycosyltransferase involved in cell wall biosynthesis
LVSPPETFLTRRLEALAARGFRVTAAAVGTGGERDGHITGVQVVSQPLWDEPPLRMLAGALADALRLGLRDPRSLGAAVAAAWSVDAATLPGQHPRASTATSRPRAGRSRLRERLLGRVSRLRSYLPLVRLRPDIVHFAWNSAAIAYLPLVRRWGCPTVVSCHGSEVNVRPYLAGGADFAARLRSSFAQVDAVHCVSRAIAGQAARHGMDPGRAWLIHSGVDAGFFVPATRRRAPSDDLRVVSVGVLRWLKGHEYALRAIDELERQGVRVQLDVLGEDSERPLGEPSDRPRLESTIAQLGLNARVRLHGHVPPQEVRRHLQGADVLLHASLSEGIPTAVLEAMACALPVVVADCGGLREAVRDGVEGFVVAPRDPVQAAAALRRLAQEPGLRAKMGAAGRATVQSRFAVDAQIDAFARLYETLLDGRGQVPRGLDLRPPAPNPPSPPPAEPACRPLRLLAAGPPTWTQALEDAVQAVRLLLDRGIDTRLAIVGQGEQIDAVTFACHQLRLGRRVEFAAAGGSPGWAKHLDRSDAVLDVSVQDAPTDVLALARERAVPVFSTSASDDQSYLRPIPSRDPHGVADTLAGEFTSSPRGATALPPATG